MERFLFGFTARFRSDVCCSRLGRALNGEGTLTKLCPLAGQAPGGIRAHQRRACVWGGLEAERGEAEPKQRVL